MAKWLNKSEKNARKVNDSKAETPGEVVHESVMTMEPPAKSLTTQLDRAETQQEEQAPSAAPINMADPLTATERDAMIEEFMRNQAMRAQKTIEKRKQTFIEKLEGKREVQTEISVRKLQINRLRVEIQARRNTIKQLKQDIKGLRSQKSPTETAADVAA